MHQAPRKSRGLGGAHSESSATKIYPVDHKLKWFFTTAVIKLQRNRGNSPHGPLPRAMHPLSWFLHTFTIPIFAEWNVGAIFRPCISIAARDSPIDYLRPEGQPYCKSRTLPHPRSSSVLLRFRVEESWTWGRDVIGGAPCRLMYSHCRPG
jgi:hypothetical protein